MATYYRMKVINLLVIDSTGYIFIDEVPFAAATPPQRRVKPPRRPMKDTCQWTTVVNLKLKNTHKTIIVAA